jgi:hypothetical protein
VSFVAKHKSIYSVSSVVDYVWDRSLWSLLAYIYISEGETGQKHVDIS